MYYALLEIYIFTEAKYMKCTRCTFLGTCIPGNEKGEVSHSPEILYIIKNTY